MYKMGSDFIWDRIPDFMYKVDSDFIFNSTGKLNCSFECQMLK